MNMAKASPSGFTKPRYDEKYQGWVILAPGGLAYVFSWEIEAWRWWKYLASQ